MPKYVIVGRPSEHPDMPIVLNIIEGPHGLVYHYVIDHYFPDGDAPAELDEAFQGEEFVQGKAQVHVYETNIVAPQGYEGLDVPEGTPINQIDIIRFPNIESNAIHHIQEAQNIQAAQSGGRRHRNTRRRLHKRRATRRRL